MILIALRFSSNILQGERGVLGNPDYNTALISTTLKNFRNQMADNLSVANPFYWWLTQNDRVREEEGGLSIEVQLLYGLNTTVRSFSGYDILDTTPCVFC